MIKTFTLAVLAFSACATDRAKKTCTCVSYSERIPLTCENTTVTAQFDVQGGGTGKEIVQNILSDGEEAWNKWYQATSATSWVLFDFNGDVRELNAFAFKSANDVPSRDPKHVDISVWLEGETEKTEVGSFDLTFTKRWETTEEFKLNVESVRATKVEFQFYNSQREIQLGQIQLFGFQDYNCIA